MKRIAVLSFALLAACGSAESTSESQGPDIQGVYASASDGPIEKVAFGRGEYTMVSKACSDGAAHCTSGGTYAMSADQSAIELTDTKTGTKQSIPFSVLKAGAPPAKGGPLLTKGLIIIGQEPAQSTETPTEQGDSPVTNGDSPVTGGDSPVTPGGTTLPGGMSITIQCTGNCALTIQMGPQTLTTTGQALTVTVPAK